jgi:hypothetical protein
VAEVVDRFHAGELDAYAVDEVLHQYSRAASELGSRHQPREIQRLVFVATGSEDTRRDPESRQAVATGARLAGRRHRPLLLREGPVSA